MPKLLRFPKGKTPPFPIGDFGMSGNGYWYITLENNSNQIRVQVPMLEDELTSRQEQKVWAPNSGSLRFSTNPDRYGIIPYACWRLLPLRATRPDPNPRKKTPWGWVLRVEIKPLRSNDYVTLDYGAWLNKGKAAKELPGFLTRMRNDLNKSMGESPVYFPGNPRPLLRKPQL